MSACDNYPTAQDAKDFKTNANTINEVVTSENDLTSPAIDGKQKTTLTGLENKAAAAVSSALSALSLVDIGDYESNVTFNNYNEYAVFERSTTPTRWRVNGNVPLPYTINSTTYPNPNQDPNLYGQPLFITEPKWDVNLPFGNKLVDTLSGALSFTRMSGTGNTNKSGVVETLGNDEPAITKDGLSVYGGYTNEVLWSENFTRSEWVKVSGATVTGGSAIAPDGVSIANLVDSGGNDFSSVRQNVSFGSGTVTISCFTKAVTSYTPSLRFEGINIDGDTKSVYSYDLNSGAISKDDGGEADSVGIETLNDGWYRIFLTVTADSISRVDLYSLRQGAGSCNFWGAQVNEGSLRPYIKTTSTPVTRATDIVSIPMMNNMPAAGEPFTASFDVNIYQSVESRRVISNGSGPQSSIILQISGSNIDFLMSNGVAYVTANAINIPDGKRSVTIKYASGVMSVYVDGRFEGTAVNTSPAYDLDVMHISSTSSGFLNLNGEIKNMRIIHSALSDDEIAALGGPDA